MAESVFQQLSLVGASSGLVKRMDAFDKTRHTPPKFASDRAKQFLAKLAASELEEWGDDLFRTFRKALDYKRKDIQLEIEMGTARIAAKDFTLERRYSLSEDEPDRYEIETELFGIGGFDLLGDLAFNDAIGPLFDRMRCIFRRENSVEGMIDAIEEAEDSDVSVDYPHDCSHCVAKIEDCDATFRFDAVSLEVGFRGCGTPGQLIAAYRQMQESLAELVVLRDLLQP